MPHAPALGRRRTRAGGFTLIEMMVTLLIFALLVGAIMTILLVSGRQKSATANEVRSTQMARTALDMLARDLRTAGFGTDFTYPGTPQPPFAYVDSLQVIFNADLTPFPDTSQGSKGIPLAYNPNGFPRPYPLDQPSWRPPARYRSGAETIRWTLDLNNDGVVDAADLTVDDAADARRTPNPDDYELCREVYGDSTGGSTLNNGGGRERVALIRRPATGGVPPLFRVYLKGRTTYWDWSNGPIPASRLAEIERIEVTVVAPSPTKNFLGQYAETRLTTEVNSIRNSPNYDLQLYTVSGYVFLDANSNGAMNGGESGISGARVTLGGYLSKTTGSTGFYTFTVPPGTYTLRHYPPIQYSVLTSPDSFVVKVGPSTTRDFADVTKPGGWVNVTVFQDIDNDRAYNSYTDKVMVDVPLTVSGTGTTVRSDDFGIARLFVPVGPYTITASLPDSFTFTTTYPLNGSMTNGATQTKILGMRLSSFGIVTGLVFVDRDGDGKYETGETLVQNAYISCTLPDGTILFAYTNSSGIYSLRLPVNDPPATVPYTVTCTPPAGFAMANRSSIGGLFVGDGKTISGQDFALSKFQLSSIDAGVPVTAIATTDFQENDWAGSPGNVARRDMDLIIGSEGNSAGDLLQFFNQYDDTQIFTTRPSIDRTSAYSVRALAVDTINVGTRPDVVTASRYRPSGNFTVWLTQSTSGNEGYLPSNYTTGMSYLTQDNGDAQAVLTYTTASGQTPTILVGTKSPGSGRGTFEVWTSSDHANPSYTRSGVYPSLGSIPSNDLGEITSMVLANLDATSDKELVVGTRKSATSGQVMVFKLVSGEWTYRWGVTLGSDAVTAVTVLDVNADGRKDIIVGTQAATNRGNIFYYRNDGSFAFTMASTKPAMGIVTALNHAEFGSDGIEDIIVGWRDSETTYGGGVRVWYTDSKTLPNSGVDPSEGMLTHMVASITVGDLNYGVYPVLPTGPYLQDFAVVERVDSGRGRIDYFIR
jgi:prepilin-type N-terminal cleavage/methylation domain-containing protein